jgi:hypothetical protein
LSRGAVLTPADLILALRRAAPAWRWQATEKGADVRFDLGACPARITVQGWGETVLRLTPEGAGTTFLPLGRTVEEACELLANRDKAEERMATLLHAHVRAATRAVGEP